MKGLGCLLLMAVMMASCASHRSAMPQTEAPQQRISRILIIFYDAETGSHALLQAAKDHKCEVIYSYDNFKGIALRVPEDWNIEEAMEYFKHVKGVLQVSRDQVLHLD